MSDPTPTGEQLADQLFLRFLELTEEPQHVGPIFDACFLAVSGIRAGA